MFRVHLRCQQRTDTSQQLFVIPLAVGASRVMQRVNDCSSSRMTSSSSEPEAQTVPTTIGTTEDTPEKQTRTRLTFAQKVDVLQRLENGEKQVTLAKELGCSRRALSRLKQNKAFFQQLQLRPSDSQRKSRHSVRNILLESNLTSFLSTAKRNRFPITGAVVRHAALKIRDELLADPHLPPSARVSLQSFQASINWSKAFVKRRSLRNAQVTQQCAVKHSDDPTTRQVTNLLREYDLDCILSVEQFNLFYKVLPTHLLSQSQSSDATETPRKHSLQERVAVFALANTTGSLKIPPTIVWNEKLPCCFDRRPCSLPHLFHPHAWIDEDVFKTWFYSILLPAVRRYTSKKVALLVNEDWLPGEVSDSQRQVQLVPVPKAEANDDGPLHMGVISVLRRKYRYCMLDIVMRMISSGYDGFQSGFAQLSHNGGLTEGHEANLLDLADLLGEAWGSINEAFIAKCWVKWGILPESHSRGLVDAYGRQDETTAEELFTSCSTLAQLEDARTLERMLLESRIAIPRGSAASTRTTDLVNKLNNVNRRELDGWFDVEETGRGLRALGAELEDVICGLDGGAIVKKGIKRSVEEIMDDTRSDATIAKRRHGSRGSRLPSIGYLIDLLSPLQELFDDQESGKGGELVRKLKMELVRLKCEEEGWKLS